MNRLPVGLSRWPETATFADVAGNVVRPSSDRFRGRAAALIWLRDTTDRAVGLWSMICTVVPKTNGILKQRTMNKNEFEKYALRHAGISSLKLHNFRSISNEYIADNHRGAPVERRDDGRFLTADDGPHHLLGRAHLRRRQTSSRHRCSSSNRPNRKRHPDLYQLPGGSVTAGLGIYDTMQLISSDVATICTGLAASMGAVLLTAGTAGKRSASPLA